MQNQAGEAEKQIQLEFQRLHQALEEEEQNRLKALAAEEERKIAAVQELTETVKKDIADLKKLIDTVKKEMGNEDLPLLQVRGNSFSATSGSVLSVGQQHLLKGCILESHWLPFLFQNFQDLKQKWAHQHAICVHPHTAHDLFISP